MRPLGEGRNASQHEASGEARSWQLEPRQHNHHEGIRMLVTHTTPVRTLARHDRITFIRKPTRRSGIIAERPTATIAVATWRGGNRHIIGGVHIAVAASSKVCRRLLRGIAASVVEAEGGAAWDDRGVIHVATTPSGAVSFARLGGAQPHAEITPETLGQLVADGLATHDGQLLDADGLELADVYPNEAAIEAAGRGLLDTGDEFTIQGGVCH